MNEYFDENVESIEMEMLDDGWYADVIWPDDMPDDEQERLEELWEEDSYSAWEGEGWVNYETESWAMGPRDIERAE